MKKPDCILEENYIPRLNNGLDCETNRNSSFTNPILSPKPDSAASNPVSEFKMDYFSAFPNSLGIPSITIPIQETWGKDPKTGLKTSAYKFPGSVKIHSYFGEDYHLLRIAK